MTKQGFRRVTVRPVPAPALLVLPIGNAISFPYSCWWRRTFQIAVRCLGTGSGMDFRFVGIASGDQASDVGDQAGPSVPKRIQSERPILQLERTERIGAAESRFAQRHLQPVEAANWCQGLHDAREW